MSDRSRNWCFTLNNWTEEEFEAIKKIECRYMIVGEEYSKEGTPHLQGFIIYKNARTFKEIKSTIPKAHIEKCKGNAIQNIEYCRKDNFFYEFGDRPKQGKRTDIEKMKELVILNAPMKEIVMEASSYQGVRYAQIAKYYLSEDRKVKPKVIWLFGKAGTGKTKWVFDNFKDIYIKDGTMWWDNYCSNECICIDDFDGKWPFRDFLRLLDRYPYQGQVKGGYVKINSPNIIITCEFNPKHFWVDNELSQVLRRIDEIRSVGHTEVGGNTESPSFETWIGLNK